MKKKILAICVVAILVITAIAGASLAYLTDTDEADNVFTVGNVQIELVEQQREYDDDGNLTGLGDFEPNKVLLPLVGSAQGAKDKYGMPTAANYVDKIINIKSIGASNAYVRVYMAVPAVLDNVGSSATNILHFNIGNKFDAEGKAEGQENVANADYAECWGEETLVAKSVDIGEVVCNVYSYTYLKSLAKDEITDYAAVVGFYLDYKVDNKMVDGKIVYTMNGKEIDYDFAQGVTIPVYAIGVQADGFANATDALDAAFGTGYNPWAN